MRSSSQAEEKNAEILIVTEDDKKYNRMKDLLETEDFVVSFIKDGEQVISSVKSHHPDLIMLDTIIQGKDGFKVCKRLKADTELTNIPVLFFSAKHSINEKTKGLKAGGAELFCEPINETEVLLRVKSQIEMHSMQKELERVNQKMRNELQYLHTTLHSIGEGVICTDKWGAITMMNQVAQNLTGWDENSAQGEDFLTVFNIINENSRVRQIDPVAQVLETREMVELANHSILISKNGIERPITDNAAPIRNGDGEIEGVVLVFRDVTDEKKHISEIEYLSLHDQLTGLYNRRFYSEELKRLDTSRRLPLTLVMSDVNGLKIINDSFGHEAGDKLIRKTAEILKQCFRSDDILCRYGGDEFIAILPNTDAELAESIIRRVQQKISENQPKNGILSVSFGMDSKVSENQRISDVLKCAEDNMYKKKMIDSPSVRGATINTVINTLFEKNSREEAHSKRVSELATRLAVSLKLPSAQIDKVRTAGLMHDIGKIIVPDDVLENPGNLSDVEQANIRKHPEIGFRILNCSPEMAELSQAILQHHERWDGSGYPSGIAGKEIDICARIIAIADAYDAMTSVRPYRNAMTPENAMNEILDNAGKQFDPELAGIFVTMCAWDICRNR